MKNLPNFIKRTLLIASLYVFATTGSFAQYYEWAFGKTNARWGQSGSFRSTDRHLNGYFFGSGRFCQVCIESYIYCYDSQGSGVWSTTFYNYPNPFMPSLISIDADHDENRYLLMQLHDLPYQIGSFSVTDSHVVVKYNKFGNIIRITSLPEKFYQIKTDSIGNIFVSNSYKVRRYNKFGNFVWEYISAFQHSLDIDDNNAIYLLGSDDVVALNINGVAKYTINEPGSKSVDPTGKLYVSSASGLKKYNRNGILQWTQPNITGSVSVNRNGNIYEFKNDSISRYNISGTVLQWQVDNPPYGKVMNDVGDFYVGGNYNMTQNSISICPYKLPQVSSMTPWEPNQVWLSKFNTNQPVPFQAAIFTGMVRTNNSLWASNKMCSGQTLQSTNGPLFEYCTSYGHSFPSNNVFSVEISDFDGNFDNAINIGEYSTALVPDTLPISSNYRVRIVSSTPDVISYPNLQDGTGNFGIDIVPDVAVMSVSGNMSLCEGESVQYSVSASDPAPYVYWHGLPPGFNPPYGSTSIILDTTGVYSAVVANYYCPIRSTDTLNLTVNPRPNPVVTASGPTSFCAGDSVILTVSDVNLNTIRWRESGSAIPGAVTAQHTVYSTGDYTARVINNFGCARASNVVSVQVTCREGIVAANSNEDIQLMPNPANGNVPVSITGLKSGNYSFILVDMEGRQAMNAVVEMTDSSVLEFPVSGLAPGMYSVIVSGGDAIITKRLMVVK